VLLELGGKVTSSGAKKGFPSADGDDEAASDEEGNVDADEDDTDKELL
jgi:hypothetical protein